MLTIGAHLTIAKGFTHAAKSAVEMDSNTFQFFSRNPRGSKVKEYDKHDLAEFQKIRKENKFGPILAHAPYTMNLAGIKDEVYEFAKKVIKEDIERMEKIEIEYFNLHPGSHVGEGIDLGIKRIINAVNESLSGKEKITILLETMSGKGTEIGFKFEHLKDIINGIEYSDKIGVCMDLCHVFSAGYDIVNDFDNVIKEFDNIIGIEKLKAIHLNDSMMPFAGRKDRHKPIGEGYIGLNAILKIIKHPYMKKLPFYLETPLDNEGHKKEIEMIRQKLNS